MNYLDTVNHLYTQFLELSKSSPVVAGAFSLWGLGVITYLVRGIPARIQAFFWRQLTTTLIINNYDCIYADLLNWITANKMHRFVRTMTLNSKSRYTGAATISMGYGRHWFFHEGKFMTMDRIVEQNQNSIEVKEKIILTVLSRSHQAFRGLFDSVRDANKQEGVFFLDVYKWGSNTWSYLSRNFPRPMESVILPETTRRSLLGHIDGFLGNRNWYQNAGVPYRTGILLYGPPGTGKTSIIKGICSHYKKDLYLLDISTLSNSQIRDALCAVPMGGIVVIEDIDATEVSKDRNAQSEKEMFSMATLSGLLNAIDGPASGEGRILIATTNHPETLDAALTRPGRIDLRLEIGYMIDETFRAYMRRLYPESTEDFDLWEVKPQTAPCTVQALIFENRRDPRPVLEAVATRLEARREKSAEVAVDTGVNLT